MEEKKFQRKLSKVVSTVLQSTGIFLISKRPKVPGKNDLSLRKEHIEDILIPQLSRKSWQIP